MLLFYAATVAEISYEIIGGLSSFKQEHKNKIISCGKGNQEHSILVMQNIKYKNNKVLANKKKVRFKNSNDFKYKTVALEKNNLNVFEW